ncbi:hypothetical protein BDZ85DRAFT_267288 [Elsinoe ampelina]|uniref:Secreted protein n=1 Tax=Elsinoe ampelina TaxID=302913 RepID=A0A6A6G3Z8_9PEZI|nr:hypothetical protein BDZ85DRAFT_267288 [Elsinoe ampelina]
MTSSCRVYGSRCFPLFPFPFLLLPLSLSCAARPAVIPHTTTSYHILKTLLLIATQSRRPSQSVQDASHHQPPTA